MSFVEKKIHGFLLLPRCDQMGGKARLDTTSLCWIVSYSPSLKAPTFFVTPSTGQSTVSLQSYTLSAFNGRNFDVAVFHVVNARFVFARLATLFALPMHESVGNRCRFMNNTGSVETFMTRMLWNHPKRQTIVHCIINLGLYWHCPFCAHISQFWWTSTHPSGSGSGSPAHVPHDFRHAICIQTSFK